MRFIRNLLCSSLIFLNIVSCAAVAQMSDFPKSYQTLDFEDIASHDYEYDGSVWNQKTEYEYYVEASNVTEDELFIALSEASINCCYSYHILCLSHCCGTPF